MGFVARIFDESTFIFTVESWQPIIYVFGILLSGVQVEFDDADPVLEWRHRKEVTIVAKITNNMELSPKIVPISSLNRRKILK